MKNKSNKYTMEWFEKFVEETREKWRADKDGLIEEDIEQLVERLIRELTTKEVGDEGEMHVEDLLQKQNFYTTTTKNSETPADVWGINIYKECVHIALIQVKTTDKGDAPKKLSEDDIKNLRILTKYVISRFLKSEQIPSDIRSKSILISNGYVGVLLDGEKHEIISSRPFTFWLPRKLSQFIDLFRELVLATHKLK